MSTTGIISTGPRTPEGKAVAALNATRHGLTSILPVLPGVESQEDWDRHLAGVAQALLPETHLEEILVERIALLLWRLRRVARYERDATAATHEELEDALTSPAAIVKEEERRADWQVIGDNPLRPFSLPSLVALIRQIHSVLDEHTYIRRPAALALLQAYADAAGGVDFQPLLPGLCRHKDPAAEVSWSGELLRKAIDKIAEQARVKYWDLTPQVLLAAAAQLDPAWPDARRRFERARAAATLPQPEVLDRVIRYEAHLNRQLLAALHELEALQARRAGRPAPLARLDVTGLSEGADK